MDYPLFGESKVLHNSKNWDMEFRYKKFIKKKITMGEKINIPTKASDMMELEQKIVD